MFNPLNPLSNQEDPIFGENHSWYASSNNNSINVFFDINDIETDITNQFHNYITYNVNGQWELKNI